MFKKNRSFDIRYFFDARLRFKDVLRTLHLLIVLYKIKYNYRLLKYFLFVSLFNIKEFIIYKKRERL